MAPPPEMSTSAAIKRSVAGSSASSSITAGGKLGDDLKISREGSTFFIQKRLALFQALFSQQQKDLEEKSKKNSNNNNNNSRRIVIALPDGTSVDGVRFKTTPLEVALQKNLGERAIVAKITPTTAADDDHNYFLSAEQLYADDDDDEAVVAHCCGPPRPGALLWDMGRVLEGSCEIEFLNFDHPEGQHVFWHSSAHVLGECLENELGAHLTVGPALERGFYYDAFTGDARITHESYEPLEKHAERIIKANQPFERLVLSKEQALEMFADNPFKVALIQSKVPDGAMTTAYRCGTLVDLCRGPHLISTGRIKSFCIEKHSAAYWLGNAQNDDLQRVYGISFPDAKMMKQYKTMVEEAKKRDHRVIGHSLNLFFFESNLSPGSCLWLADGTKIYNKLCDFIRAEYRHRGFTEVISPNIYSCDLFKVSGHYQNYKENMYCFDVEGKEWAMKPMNCPGHCLIFRHLVPSYRNLPIRLADFGVLHRNEVSGSLTGLIRVRRFQQDDAHIFCRQDQVKSEVLNALDFLFHVYGVFGFTFDIKLSTRPAKALGEIALWDAAEKALAEAMDASGKPWTLNPGDGAFYGPKIDIRVQDALQRWHQCGTIQLDFQLPLRFNLTYRTADETIKKLDDNDEENGTAQVNPGSAVIGAAEQGRPSHPEVDDDDGATGRPDGSWEAELKPGFARPVMVHRAILGSLERMVAVLLEHTGGKLPFWLSPRQLLVCPISEKSLGYAKYVAEVFYSRGYDVVVDESNATINKKIRQGQLERWNYILVVGQQEQDTNQVTVRDRDDPKNQSQLSIEAAVKKFEALRVPHIRDPVPIRPFEAV